MAATKTTSRSRKTGDPRADQAESDRRVAAENAKIQPGPAEDDDEREDDDELCMHDLDPATCAECNGSAAAERQAEAGPQAEPEPSQPTAQLNIGRYPYWLHRPQLVGPDGATHTCQHRDGHGQIKAAMACARSLGSQFGLAVPAVDPSWPEGGPGEPVS
jgi:hypothetical protein